MKPPLLVLTGPTAVGKTKLSISLAKAINGEIISADSMQVYRHMDIGSAKIRKEEMEGVPHYLVDVLEPEEEFHIVKFQQMAKEAMKEIYSRNKIPILVGGTGFYIQSVTKDIDFTEAEQETAEEIHENNVKRVIRALEFYEQNGFPISQHNAEQKQRQSPYQLAYFVLNAPRPLLYERIDRRVDEMIQEGLVKEVQTLKERGCHRGMVSMQGLGYKEILDYLEGNCSLEEAVRILKRDTRHFAKRQITWFKREEDVTWVNKDDFDYNEEKILEYMLSVCREKQILKQTEASI